MGHLLLPQRVVERAEPRLFRGRERPPERPPGEGHHRVDLPGLDLHEPLAKGLGIGVDGRLEWCPPFYEIGPVLGGVAQDLLVGVVEFERLLGDEQQLVPEPVELPRLGLAEHEPTEVIVLAMIEIQRDHLVDGHDAAVADGLGEKRTNVGERLLESPPRGGVLPGHDRQRWHEGGRRCSIACIDAGFELHACFSGGLRMDRTRRHEFASFGQFRRDRDRDRAGRLQAQISCLDREALWMPTEQRGVEAHGDGLLARLVSARNLVLRRLDPGQERACCGAEQLPELGVGGALFEIGAVAGKKPLEVGGELFAVLFPGRRDPPSQE